MNEKHIVKIAANLGLHDWQVRNTLAMFAQGATIPFVSRYRKEKTGSLDEVILLEIQKQSSRLAEIDDRRTTVLDTIRLQDQLTPELEARILAAETMTELEDLYLPYKPKRKTRGTKARELGLEPLAKVMMAQQEASIERRAEQFINDQVATAEDALSGARDIVAEWINENSSVRNSIRRLFEREAVIRTQGVKGKEEEGRKYSDYFDFNEHLKRSPSHRLMAIFRGEREGFLRVSVEPDSQKAIEWIAELVLRSDSACRDQIEQAIKDAYNRLIEPSIENEFRTMYRERADESAIHVFAENLRQLLLMPPLGRKNILAIDPGYRSGCKLVCLDRQGNLLHNETIYPHPPQREAGPASRKIKSLADAYKIEAIAIGNGTASRETEQFIKQYIRFDKEVEVYVVSESGASVYSASPVAREEFPDYDVTVRGAVSIGRRLMDPLAELVKIDPKSIGVGQYQHDLDQKKLHESLDMVVVSCVNQVGVEVNTASKHLLTYVSGLGPGLAQNIVDYRRENGPFTSREELRKVPRLGPKAYEQAAGFLRIQDAENPLDNSAVHPESYAVVKKMTRDLGYTVKEIMGDAQLRQKIDLEKYVSPETGLPTLKDILEELSKPGRDPRGKILFFEFSSEVQTIDDVRPGMLLPGLVTNITRFGVFVDIGVKQDGLVHISELADRFVKDPAEVVKLHQAVTVRVLEVDLRRNRIQLSMKGTGRSAN